MNCPPFISRLQQMQEYCKSRSVNNDKKALTSFDLPSESTEKMYAENYKILSKPFLITLLPFLLIKISLFKIRSKKMTVVYSYFSQ